MSEIIQSFDVSNLILYHDNPRYDDIAENQRDAILKIVDDQQDKLIKLATEIVEYGFSYMDMVVITKDEFSNKYIVREGSPVAYSAQPKYEKNNTIAFIQESWNKSAPILFI